MERRTIPNNKARDRRADDLHMAQAFRWLSGERSPAAEAARGRECRLKKLVAERDLEIEIMKEVAAKLLSVPARRPQVRYGRERGLRGSQRRPRTCPRSSG